MFPPLEGLYLHARKTESTVLNSALFPPATVSDPASTQPSAAPSLFKLCRRRMVFSYAHVFTCQEYRIPAGSRARWNPHVLTPLVSQTVTAVTPSQPWGHSHPPSLCAPRSGSHTGVSVSSTRLEDLSQYLAQIWHLAGT